MADATVSDEPTEEEITVAQDVFARKARADQARRDAVMQPVKDLVASEAFALLLAEARTLQESMNGTSPFQECVEAMVVGMAGLQQHSAA